MKPIIEENNLICHVEKVSLLPEGSTKRKIKYSLRYVGYQDFVEQISLSCSRKLENNNFVLPIHCKNKQILRSLKMLQTEARTM